MKRAIVGIIWIFMLAVLLLGAGCSGKQATDVDKQIPGEEPREQVETGANTADYGQAPEEERSQTSLGDIHLGESADSVRQKLGEDYTPETFAEEGFFGEGYQVWHYAGGMDLIIGLESKKVLQIEVKSPKYPTDAGTKVGDSAEKVLEQYRAEYEEFEGANSDGKLAGWFRTEEHVILIFSFNEDHSRFNESVNADSTVQAITLAYTFFFD